MDDTVVQEEPKEEENEILEQETMSEEKNLNIQNENIDNNSNNKKKNNKKKLIILIIVIVVLLIFVILLFIFKDELFGDKSNSKNSDNKGSYTNVYDNKVVEIQDDNKEEVQIETSEQNEEQDEERHGDNIIVSNYEDVEFYKSENHNFPGIYAYINGESIFFMDKSKEDGIYISGYNYDDNGKLYYYYKVKSDEPYLSEAYNVGPYIINYINITNHEEHKKIATIKVENIEGLDENQKAITPMSIIDVGTDFLYYGFQVKPLSGEGHDEIVVKYDLKTKESKVVLHQKNIPAVKYGGGGYINPSGKIIDNKLYLFIGNQDKKRSLYIIDKNDNIELIDSDTGIMGGYNPGPSMIKKHNNKIYYVDEYVKVYNPTTKKIDKLFKGNGHTYIDKNIIYTPQVNKIYFVNNEEIKDINIKILGDDICHDYKGNYYKCEDSTYIRITNIKNNKVYFYIEKELLTDYGLYVMDFDNLQKEEVTLTTQNISKLSKENELFPIYVFKLFD